MLRTVRSVFRTEKHGMSSGSVQEERVTFRELKLSPGILSEWKLVKMIMTKAFSLNLHNNL